MKVYAVFLCWTKRAEDHEVLQAIFSTQKKAEAFVDMQDLDYDDDMFVKEFELDSKNDPI